MCNHNKQLINQNNTQNVFPCFHEPTFSKKLDCHIPLSYTPRWLSSSIPTLLPPLLFPFSQIERAFLTKFIARDARLINVKCRDVKCTTQTYASAVALLRLVSVCCGGRVEYIIAVIGSRWCFQSRMIFFRSCFHKWLRILFRFISLMVLSVVLCLCCFV